MRQGFRQQIEAAIERKRLRLQDVAERMGVTTGYVSRVWNEDEEKISLAAIEKICEGVGIDPVDIDLYVEKMLPYLAREADGIRQLGRDMLHAQRGFRKGKVKKTA